MLLLGDKGGVVVAGSGEGWSVVVMDDEEVPAAAEDEEEDDAMVARNQEKNFLLLLLLRFLLTRACDTSVSNGCSGVLSRGTNALLSDIRCCSNSASNANIFFWDKTYNSTRNDFLYRPLVDATYGNTYIERERESTMNISTPYSPFNFKKNHTIYVHTLFVWYFKLASVNGA